MMPIRTPAGGPRRTALLVAGLCCAAPELTAQQLPLEREIAASPGQSLKLDLDTGGSVHVVGSDRRTVAVRVTEGNRRCEDCRVEVTQTSAGVRVRSWYEGERRSRSSSLRVEAQVPRRFDVEVETMGGGVEIENLEGKVTGETMGGGLNLSGLTGRVDLTTMGGGIHLARSQVDGRVKTMGGNVVLEDVTGNVDASTMGGTVTRRRVTPRTGANGAGGEVRMRSMGGDITLDDAPHGAELTTMGGDIRVRSAGGPVRAKTMGGKVQLEAVDGSIRASTMGGDVSARMVGDPARGDRSVELSSLGGDIELIVPEGLAMDVEVELIYSPEREGRYRITSDFPLQQTVEDYTERNHDRGERRRIRATGRVGNAQHAIRIRTMNGNVRLRRG